MIGENSKYHHIKAYSGIGSDIKWCGRWTGGKRCLYCHHHAKFEEWSQTWHWHYLMSWYEEEHYGKFAWWNFVQSYYTYGGKFGRWWPAKVAKHPKVYNDSPSRYYTVGLKEAEIKALLRKGCRKKRKCKCVNIAQRGSWCCPECYPLLKRLAQHHGVDIHEVLIADRNDLKHDILILLLSGTL